MFTNWENNEAVIKEKVRIKEACEKVLDMDINNFEYEFDLRNQRGYITHGWLVYKFPAKGNYKFTKFFKEQGFQCKSEKIVTGSHGSLRVKIVAEKRVEFLL